MSPPVVSPHPHPKTASQCYLRLSCLTSNRFYARAAFRVVQKQERTQRCHLEPRLFAHNFKKRLQDRHVKICSTYARTRMHNDQLLRLITLRQCHLFRQRSIRKSALACIDWRLGVVACLEQAKSCWPARSIHMSVHISTRQCLGSQRLMTCRVSEAELSGGTEDLRRQD